MLHFSKELNFWEMLSWQHFNIKSVGIGLASGALAAGLGLLLLQILPNTKIDELLNDVLSSINPTWYHILFYSFCAGVGEEILFRGAVQHDIFLWPTALLFVLIHGYLNPKDKSLFIFGVFLVFISGGFGYLFKYLGIYAAISAHFLYDVIMFAYMKYKSK